MKARSLLIFSGVTAAVVVAAVVAQGSLGTSDLPTGGKKFFPGFDTALNSAASLSIKHKGKTFTMRDTGKGWVIDEKHGYPARFDRIKKALVGVSELRSFEAKTNDPKRFSKLKLADPAGSKDTESRLLTIKDKAGKALATLILGRVNTNSAVFGREMVYVRLPGKNQAWLALGNPDVLGGLLDWLPKEIADIRKERVKEVTLTPVKGDPAVVTRDKPADKDFGIKNMPEGFKERTKRLIGAVPGVLRDLDLEDVRPAKDIDFKKNNAGAARFATFDGIVIDMNMAKVDKDLWVTVTARFDPTQAVKTDGKDKDSKIKAAADAEKEAKEIATRAAGWAYKLSTTNRRFLQFKKSDLIEKKKEVKKDSKKDPKTDDKKDDKSAQ